MHMGHYSCDTFSEPKLPFEPFITWKIEDYVQSILLDINESAPKAETHCIHFHFFYSTHALECCILHLQGTWHSLGDQYIFVELM